MARKSSSKDEGIWFLLFLFIYIFFGPSPSRSSEKQINSVKQTQTIETIKYIYKVSKLANSNSSAYDFRESAISAVDYRDQEILLFVDNSPKVYVYSYSEHGMEIMHTNITAYRSNNSFKWLDRLWLEGLQLTQVRLRIHLISTMQTKPQNYSFSAYNSIQFANNVIVSIATLKSKLEQNKTTKTQP